MKSFPQSTRVWLTTALVVFLAGQSSSVTHAQAQTAIAPSTGAVPTLPSSAVAETNAVEANSAGAAPAQVGVAPDTAESTGTATADVDSAGRQTVALTLRQLGAWSAPRLTGSQGVRDLVFGVRPDKRVVSAVLKLGYDYSPALQPDLSHFVVALNAENVAILSLPAGASLRNRREIPLDPALFRRGDNTLQLRFVGKSAGGCEVPPHDSIWLSISEATRLVLTLAPAPSDAVDLSRAHDLFVQSNVVDAQVVPVVVGDDAGFGTYKAAGIVASWLGAQTRNRNLRFKVVVGEVPRDNAIVLTSGIAPVQGVRGSQNATLSLQTNPSDPNARILVLSGADEAALERAARALALTQRTLSGATATIVRDVAPPPRKPYDAPAWLPLDRPVRFGEIAGPAELNVRGYYPGTIRVNYRVPPDLFAWRSDGAPVVLRYHASSLPSQWNSALNVSLNREQLQSIAINHGRIEQVAQALQGDERAPEARPSGSAVVEPLENSALRSSKFNLPPHAITGRDQLQLQFSFEVVRRGVCQDIPVDNMIGTIDAESTVDFSGFPHYAAMPNLEFFSSLGFPFTRMADLGETAVVLPERPDPRELGLYLSTMALMGESTGFPALRHTLATAAALDGVADRDLLVIGSGSAQGLLGRWAESLPIVDVGGERRLREVVESWRPTYRWAGRDIDPQRDPAGYVSLAAPGMLSALMGFESPLEDGRSVVFLYADRPDGLDRIAATLADPARSREIKGDFSMIDDRFIETAKVTPTYYVGELPVVSRLQWLLQDQPMLLALIGVFGVLLLALLAYRMLRRRRG